ncbi:MAG: DegV family EDD domain-containing protein, partial [Oscillospiraceae bacterium]|nr:DegV family EDD domain-containing protein [Oscillospiraceae bacterium]
MVDTSCDLPREYMDAHNVQVIPIPFHIDGKLHSGGQWQEISDKEFYKALSEGSVAGTTMTNPESYVQVFSEYAQRGEDLLMIILSSGLSGSYENSCIALDEVKEKYPDCNIRTIDSITAAGGVGLLTVLAIKKRDEGLSVSDAAAWLEEKKSSCISLF